MKTTGPYKEVNPAVSPVGKVMKHSSVRSADVTRNRDSRSEMVKDLVVVEEPLEIRLNFGLKDQRRQNSLVVTMRTPGNDFELAMGFLFTEGMISSKDQVIEIKYCEALKDPEEEGNVILVYLDPDLEVNFKKHERSFYANSSCGVCGKSSIEQVGLQCGQSIPGGGPVVEFSWLQNLPSELEKKQPVFAHTGGIHAAALFDLNGKLLGLREDVGRHNALDKLIGAMVAQGHIPLTNLVGLVSGRAGFELVQKSIVAGLPILAAVGAPTSLALDLARAYNLTLIGFLRKDRFNVYTGEERVSFSSKD